MSLLNKSELTFFDGGMGTMLQAAGLTGGLAPELAALTHFEVVADIHRQYALAGADIVCANTFGANAHKLQGCPYSVQEVITASVAAAQKGVAGTGARVALDVGPLGELLEPAGTLTFEEAYALYAEVMQAGQAAGADLVLIETMTDLYETKAALLAAKENTSLPVFVSMTFEQTGRTFAGTSVEIMVMALAPLAPAALGINCSLGPKEVLPLAKKLCACSPLPVFVKPNAGLPHPLTGKYELIPQQFAHQMAPIVELSVNAVGGCCGTTPQTIGELHRQFANTQVLRRAVSVSAGVCSATRQQLFLGVHPIGERINPTGKKKLKEALAKEDFAYIQTLAVTQQTEGAHILDVNVGTPGVDEVSLLPRVVKAIQAVCDLPLQLDSANPAALEAALRVYNGKPIVNSTSGEQEKLNAVLPLCKKYGAAVVGLTLDENGIPETAMGRFNIAQNILHAALDAGIKRQDVLIDCLVLTASALPGSAQTTLDTLTKVKKDLGLTTVLGVSNISFGLPARSLVNQTFLAMALQAGLNLPIMNPADEGMQGAIRAFNLLDGTDADAAVFVAAYADKSGGEAPREKADTQVPHLGLAIERGLKAEAAEAARQMLADGEDGLVLVNQYLMPALDNVGQGFETGRIFLPQLLASAGAAGAAFEEIKATYKKDAADGPPVVLATVKGDIHDIGKNIVKVLLQNYGFSVTDLGRDVPPDAVVKAAQKTGAKLVGLSALMTTTLPAMAQTIEALQRAQVNCEVVVGGAVLTKAYALQIGANHYAKDAKATVDVARKIYAGRQPLV